MPAQSNHEDVMSDWKKQQSGEGQEPQNAVNVHICICRCVKANIYDAIGLSKIFVHTFSVEISYQKH